MNHSLTLGSKKAIFFIIIITIAVLILPSVAYAAISVEIHPGTDSSCSTCASFSGLSKVQDITPGSSETNGPITFSYIDQYHATVGVASGYSVQYITVQAGDQHKLYTLYDQGPHAVDSGGIMIDQETTAPIDHICVWYSKDVDETAVAGAVDIKDATPATGDETPLIMLVLSAVLLVTAAGIRYLLKSSH